MVQFVGALAATLRTDPRYLMTWDNDAYASGKDASERVNALVRPANTVAEWLAVNRDLGETLLLSYLESVSGTLEQQQPQRPVVARIGQREHDACFDLHDLDSPFGPLSTYEEDADDDAEVEALVTKRMEADLIKKRAEHEASRHAYLEEANDDEAAIYLTANRELGRAIVELETDIAKRKAESSRRFTRGFLHKATELLKAGQVEVAFAPAWAWECMGSAVWRRFVRMDALAAVAKAHALVNSIPGCEHFTVKELICSHGVFGNFSFLVAYQYLSTTDCIPSAPQKAAGAGRSGNMTYINVEHMRRALAGRVETCKVWFETHVHRRPNALLDAFDRKQREMIKERPYLADNARWLEAMKRYRAMMPRWELVVVVPFTMDQ